MNQCNHLLSFVSPLSLPLLRAAGTKSPSVFRSRRNVATTSLALRQQRSSSSSSSNHSRSSSSSSSRSRPGSSPTKQKQTRKKRPTSTSTSTSASTSTPRSDSSVTSEAPVPKYLSARPTRGQLSNVGTARALINWYPGHIAKAERNLQSSLKLVDVVIEVLDARIPLSTCHPLLDTWLSPSPSSTTSKLKIIALSRSDLIPSHMRARWVTYFSPRRVFFLDCRRGTGVSEMRKHIISSSHTTVNERRVSRGLLPRSVRVLVVGFPNVGKSALINKLVGRTIAKSENRPGVTRNFQWIRIAPQLELLDMPGIIPAKLISQQTALRLAFCDDIGHAAYDNQIVAARLLDFLIWLANSRPTERLFDFSILSRRFAYQNVAHTSGEDFLEDVAQRPSFNGDVEKVAVRLLTEFRAGTLGPVALEVPEMVEEQGLGKEEGQRKGESDCEER